MCPVGSVGTWFVEVWIIVAQLSGSSSVKSSIKVNVVQNLVKK